MLISFDNKLLGQTKPNIILIYSDDMGYADLSITGNKYIQTKNIDAIGKEGISFTQAYTTAPLCSPSRAGLLTGRYQQKFGFEYQSSTGAYPNKRSVKNNNGPGYTHIDVDTSDFERRGVPVSELNLAEILKPNGYTTGVIGKWHLGFKKQFFPENRGFDYSFVFLGNTSLQYKDLDSKDFISKKVDERHDSLPLTAWTREGINALRENGKITDVNDYLVWKFRDKAIDFINDNKDKSFFLYLPINAPVPPLQVPKSYYDRVTNVPDDNKRAYQAFLLAYDEAIGKVLNRVKELGLDKNTIIIFANDNGNSTTRPGDNSPFSGGKFITYEGGIRTPYLIKWPGHIKPGSVYDKVVSTLDILPTITAAAHVPLPAGKQTDGVDLLPYINGENTGTPHEVLYWKLGNYAAIRKGDWKLFIDTDKNLLELYDLGKDLGEKNDLAKQFPGKVAELKSAYDTWHKALPAPLWVNVNYAKK